MSILDPRQPIDPEDALPRTLRDHSTRISDLEKARRRGLFLRSPNGTRYQLTVDNAGNLSAVLAPEPPADV